MKSQLNRLLVIAALFVAVVTIVSCKKEHLAYTTTSDVSIVGYLQNNTDQFSELIKILKLTDTYNYLNAYGAYTCFAPTNTAIQAYLQQLGKSKVEDVDTATLKNMIRLHLIEDTLSTKQFTDGKMPSRTMLGQYLITGVTNISGVSYITVNRQANILQSNIYTVNGYIHVLDHVLYPATLTMAKYIEQNTSFSIFTQALKETGYYDSLNIVNNPDATRYWLTVLAQSDSVYKANNITTYAALKAKYSNTGNPKSNSDSLHIYMAYHVLTGIKYLADIVSATSHPTLAPLEVVTSKLSGQAVLINDDDYNGVHEPGIELSRINSDNTCTNGVVHYALGNIFVKKREPFTVNFDLGDQPEIRKLTSIFRKNGKFQQFNIGDLADVTWQRNVIQYTCDATNGSNFHWWYDHMDWPERFGNSAANTWIEFKTPLIVRGRYKVWFCYRKSSHGQYTQMSFDGQPLPRIMDCALTFLNTAISEAELESQGYKRYSADAPTSNSTQIAQMAGIVDVTTTDRHIVRFEAIRDQGSTANPLLTADLVQFIPITAPSQTRPLFKRDGTIVP